MTQWIDVINADALAPGEHHTLEIEHLAIVVFNVDGVFYAVEDLCSHDEQPLADGRLSGTTIACPAHGALFCLRTGKPLSPPAYEPIRHFATRIEDGTVQINLQAH